MSELSRLQIQERVPLAEVSTFGIGGRAEFFVEADTADEIVAALRWAEERGVSARVMAGGSNIVFPDKGLEGLLVRVRGGALHTDIHGFGNGCARITADAGVALGDVVHEAVTRGLAGLETLSGIPGTIGGAVYGNAGAYGHAIADAVVRVEVLAPQSHASQISNLKSQIFERRWVPNAECGFAYRESVFKKHDWIILCVELRLVPGNAEELQKKSHEIIETRARKYKPGLRCPGSFFKNVLVADAGADVLTRIDRAKIIEGKIPAGYLLETVGAKGMREGGVYIADFHGNLLVNDGTGTAADVKKLARALKEKVSERFGIALEEEVRYF